MYWLLILFLFQSALASTFTYMVGRLVVKDVPQRTIRKIRNYFAVLTVVLSSAVFLAFYKSIPTGEPGLHAVAPAAWMICIFGGILIALTLVIPKAMPDHE